MLEVQQLLATVVEATAVELERLEKRAAAPSAEV